MEHRLLGRTGISVSALCLGTMTFGQQTSEADAFSQMDFAVANGIDFFDTAELYAIPPKRETQGATERIIGNWLHARGGRDKLVIATKVIGRSVFDWFREDGSKGRINRSQVMEAVDKSLKRLQTDYIDHYQLHWPERPMAFGGNPTQFDVAGFKPADDEVSFKEQLEILNDCVKAGKIRAIGLSNESAWGTMRFLAESEAHGLPRVSSVQNAYHLMNRTYETAMAEIAMRENIGLLAYSPLAQGYLTGKYLDGERPAGSRSAEFNRGQRYEKPGSEDAIRDYLALAKELGVDIVHLALAFVTSRPFLTANIIGARTLDQLKHAMGSRALKITPEIEAKINAIHQVRGNPAP